MKYARKARRNSSRARAEIGQYFRYETNYLYRDLDQLYI